MEQMNCLFLDRANIKEGLKTILIGIEKVKGGVSMWIFPEGTRNESKDPADLMEFHEGSLKIAEKSGCPVIPVAITGTAEVFEAHFPKIHSSNVTIEFGAPFIVKELEPEQRKEYAKTLVELGAGRRLWEAPLCFGECDGALRVRAAVAWRPLTPVRRLTGLFCAALVFLLFAGAPAVPGGVTETDLSRNLTQMEEAPEKVVEELIRRLEEKGDLLSGVSIAAGWWKWEGTGGRIYLETSVGTWRAFRCVLGESGKMGMIQLRQEGRPHDLADCTQFYPVD